MVSYHLAGVASRERGSQDLAQSVRGRAEVALSVCGSHHRWPGFLPRGCRPLPVRGLGPKCWEASPAGTGSDGRPETSPQFNRLLGEGLTLIRPSLRCCSFLSRCRLKETPSLHDKYVYVTRIQETACCGVHTVAAPTIRTQIPSSAFSKPNVV